VSGWPPPISRRAEVALVLAILGLALTLRVVGHWYAPHGWREDELSNALVISQHVREGEVRLYYADASGHEGLYHWLQAGTMALFGPGVAGVRGVSIALGTLAVLLLYLLAREMYGWPTAAVASLALAVSFWGLMYSRSGQRHVSVTVTTLAAFVLLWRGFRAERPVTSAFKPTFYALAGVMMGVGFYTYFASRGPPLILLAFGVYLLIWRREVWARAWRGLGLALLIGGALGLPLAIRLAGNPGIEARVAELAGPLRAAREGDLAPLRDNGLVTLSMFTHDGDDEVLYNVPHRPVFGVVGAVLFVGGVAIALIGAFGRDRDPRGAFLLAWLVVGLIPGAISQPAASLSHTILAQPAAMLMPVLALDAVGGWLAANRPRQAGAAVLAAAVLLLGSEAVRGVRDYFVVWPSDPFNRVLHHSDLHEAALILNAAPENRNVVIGGFLAERWDQQVMRLDLAGNGWRVRAFDPRQAVVCPAGGGRAILPEYLTDSWAVIRLVDPFPLDAPYRIYRLDDGCAAGLSGERLAAFDDGLELIGYSESALSPTERALEVVTIWRVGGALDLPPRPLLAKPPAPGQVDSLHLAVFVQLLDGLGMRVAGADGIGVDPYTLYPGDVFWQRQFISLDGVPPGDYLLVVGLYDPLIGSRHVDAITGLDMVMLGRVALPAPD
jgi:4-amino-4-deoxy-L-arabinose transferase-like glycosyltransferase